MEVLVEEGPAVTRGTKNALRQANNYSDKAWRREQAGLYDEALGYCVSGIELLAGQEDAESLAVRVKLQETRQRIRTLIREQKAAGNGHAERPLTTDPKPEASAAAACKVCGKPYPHTSDFFATRLGKPTHVCIDCRAKQAGLGGKTAQARKRGEEAPEAPTAPENAAASGHQMPQECANPAPEMHQSCTKSAPYVPAPVEEFARLCPECNTIRMLESFDLGSDVCRRCAAKAPVGPELAAPVNSAPARDTWEPSAADWEARCEEIGAHALARSAKAAELFSGALRLLVRSGGKERWVQAGRVQAFGELLALEGSLTGPEAIRMVVDALLPGDE